MPLRPESRGEEFPACRGRKLTEVMRCRHYLLIAAVAEALPMISLLPDTLPAAEHRTYQLFFGSAYGKRAWPCTFVSFDIQTAYGPLNAAAFCTETFCDATARPRLFLTVQVIIE